jgi:hypothetical protein
MSWIQTTIRVDEDEPLTSDEITNQTGLIAPMPLIPENAGLTTELAIQTDPTKSMASMNTFNETLNHSPPNSTRHEGEYAQNSIDRFFNNKHQYLFEIIDASQNLSAPLDYIRQKKGNAAKVIEDEKAVASLVEIDETFRRNNEKIQFIIESKLYVTLKEMLKYINEKLVEYVNKNEFDIEYENTNSTFTSFHLVTGLIEALVVQSKDFASFFHIVGGTKCLLSFFENSKLANYLSKSWTSMDPLKNDRKFKYGKTLASMLNSLLYMKSSRHQAFREFFVIETLSQFANNLTYENCELILRSHLVLAELCSCRQIESLLNIDFTILILEKTIQMLAQACHQKIKCNLYEFDLFYGQESTFELSSFQSPNTFIVWVLSCMEAFLVNDNIKYRAFGTLKDSLLVLLIEGDLIEKYLALSLLVTFCFDETLCEKVRKNDAGVIELLEKMLKQLNLDESIKLMSFCLKNLLLPKYANELNRKSSLRKKIFSLSKKNTIKCIFISYHEENELICLRMRNELESLGYEVTLNERKLAGNHDFFEGLLKSIENADCVLICMSSSYENDKLCHFEAFYGKKLKKFIMPIIVEEKYEPDYWLEKYVIDFSAMKVSLNTIQSDVLEMSKSIQPNTTPSNESKVLKIEDSSKASSICQIL